MMNSLNLMRSSRVLAGLLSAGLVMYAAAAAAAPLDEPAYAGRRIDHVIPAVAAPTERAEFAAMESSTSLPVSEPAYSGRRADHMPQLLIDRKERSEFAALESGAGSSMPPRGEMAYGSRRADHLELYR